MPIDALPRTDALAIYLNDHLAGASGGLELFKRATRAATSPRREVLERLTAEAAQDRQTLLSIMASLDLPVRRYKVAAGWLGEKAGRAKLNGRLLRRAPLSSLEEAEMLTLVVFGKAAGWKALRELAHHDVRLDIDQLDRLIDRAHGQADELELLRVEVARAVFVNDPQRPEKQRDPGPQSNGG